jgi:hypothetical protein
MMLRGKTQQNLKIFEILYFRIEEIFVMKIYMVITSLCASDDYSTKKHAKIL